VGRRNIAQTIARPTQTRRSSATSSEKLEWVSPGVLLAYELLRSTSFVERFEDVGTTATFDLGRNALQLVVTEPIDKRRFG